MNKFKNAPGRFLKKNYVPDVYQPSIYAIDYQKLKDAGIKLISFDIDDTIAPLTQFNPPKTAIILFQDLKNMGFELMLLTNALNVRAKNFADKLGISGCYIARAKKPLTTHFQTMQERFGLEKSQMAHVGNSIMDDVAGGNSFEIMTCMVRAPWNVLHLPKPLPGVNVDAKELRKELKERGIWRKHHKYDKGDQYYQLGEAPGYIVKEQGDAYQEAMQASEKQYLRDSKDSIK